MKHGGAHKEPMVRIDGTFLSGIIKKKGWKNCDICDVLGANGSYIANACQRGRMTQESFDHIANFLELTQEERNCCQGIFEGKSQEQVSGLLTFKEYQQAVREGRRDEISPVNFAEPEKIDVKAEIAKEETIAKEEPKENSEDFLQVLKRTVAEEWLKGSDLPLVEIMQTLDKYERRRNES